MRIEYKLKIIMENYPWDTKGKGVRTVTTYLKIT
jgi:hypothetical protein